MGTHNLFKNNGLHSEKVLLTMGKFDEIFRITHSKSLLVVSPIKQIKLKPDCIASRMLIQTLNTNICSASIKGAKCIFVILKLILMIAFKSIEATPQLPLDFFKIVGDFIFSLTARDGQFKSQTVFVCLTTNIPKAY